MSYRTTEVTKVTQIVEVAKVTQIEEEITMIAFYCDVCGDCLVQPKETYNEALTELLSLEDICKVSNKDTNGNWKHSCCHKNNNDFKKYLKEKRIQEELAEACKKANEQAARSKALGPGCHCGFCSQLHPTVEKLIAIEVPSELAELLRIVLQKRG